jgi:hypothetical protein
MTNAPFDLQRAHRWFAVELNNLAWDTLGMETRTDEQNERMLNAAHAACLHWHEVGTELNHQRALCLLATVHARLGYADSAVRYANKCLELSAEVGEAQTPFDVATNYGCAALAYNVAGQEDKAAEMLAKAQKVAAAFTDAEDKSVFERFYVFPVAAQD